MPQKINIDTSKVSVELGEKLKARLIVACAESDPPISPSAAVRAALVRWLDARERNVRRKRAAQSKQ